MVTALKPPPTQQRAEACISSIALRQGFIIILLLWQLIFFYPACVRLAIAILIPRIFGIWLEEEKVFYYFIGWESNSCCHGVCFFVCLFFLFLQNGLKEVRTYGIKWMVGFPSSRAQHGRGAPNWRLLSSYPRELESRTTNDRQSFSSLVCLLMSGRANWGSRARVDRERESESCEGRDDDDDKWDQRKLAPVTFQLCRFQQENSLFVVVFASIFPFFLFFRQRERKRGGTEK